MGGKLVDGGPGELEILEILIRKIKQRNVEPDQTGEEGEGPENISLWEIKAAKIAGLSPGRRKKENVESSREDCTCV